MQLAATGSTRWEAAVLILGCSDVNAVHGDWLLFGRVCSSRWLEDVDAWWKAAVLGPAYLLRCAVCGGRRLFARGYHCNEQPALA